MLTNTPNNILQRQVDILFKSSISGGLSNIFAAWMIFVLVHNNTEYMTNALILGVSVTTLTIIRTILTETYLKNQNLSLNKSLAGYLFLTFSVGVVWAIFEYIQGSHNDEEIRNIVFLFNFGLIAGSIAILSAWLPAFLVYVLPQAGAIFFVFLNLDYESNYFISLTFLIFLAVMIISSFNVNRRRKKEIALTFHNEQLINDLNAEIHIREKVQQELEQNKSELELKVDERTKDLVAINEDLSNVIKKKEAAEERLQYIAYHDGLTGLPNRNLLIDRINHSIESAFRNKQQLGILFLDLDRFKTINDTLGHIIGDKLIQQVSKRLLATLRKEDTISRNGGDEFVVVIQRMTNSDHAIGIAQKIIEALTSIFDIDSHKIHIGVSIGISIYPNDGNSALELLRNADTAMFSAKKAGGNLLHFYNQSMSNRLHERLAVETELHTAISRNEFYMVYQPQVDCTTGVTTGFEALMRWKNTELGFVGPNQFIPLLEESGLIYEVGRWAITHIFNFIKSGQAKDVVISINLSALQCSDVEFVDFIHNEMTKAGINPRQLTFEITESLLINDFEKTELFLNKLHATGCSIALDDFGTGYTSMSYLTRLPIDCIKVDQSFVRNIDSNSALENIVKAIVTMSTSLGLKNVFEGVETVAELEVIKKLDGRVIQGYLYSKPLNADEIEKWLRNAPAANVEYIEAIPKYN